MSGGATQTEDWCIRWGELLTVAQSRALMDEVDHWCRRTGTNYNRLVVVAGIGATTRHMIRIKGKRITAKSAAKLKKAMEANRFGISKERYRTISKPWGCKLVPVEMQEKVEIELRRIVRDTCPRCGAVRMDYVCGGCLSAKHSRLRVA